MNIRKIEAITRDAYYEQQERDNKERKKSVKKRIKDAAKEGKNFIDFPYLDEQLIEKLEKDGFEVKLQTHMLNLADYRVSWKGPNFDERI